MAGKYSSQSDVQVPALGIDEELLKQLSRCCELRGVVVWQRTRIEVLPEHSSAASPLRAVQREREDGVEAPSVGQAVSDRSPREVLGSWNEGSQFYYGCLFPV